jgi:hypothetical protein
MLDVMAIESRQKIGQIQSETSYDALTGALAWQLSRLPTHLLCASLSLNGAAKVSQNTPLDCFPVWEILKLIRREPQRGALLLSGISND